MVNIESIIATFSFHAVAFITQSKQLVCAAAGVQGWPRNFNDIFRLFVIDFRPLQLSYTVFNASKIYFFETYIYFFETSFKPI